MLADGTAQLQLQPVKKSRTNNLVRLFVCIKQMVKMCIRDRPYIELHGDAKKQYQKLKFEITLTHTHTTAAAVVIAMQED